MVSNFDAILHGRIHLVQYERVIEDIEGEVRRMLAYLNLPYDPACLRFHENSRPVDTPSSEQVRRPINREGLSRRSEEHTSELQSLMRISYAVFCLKKKKTN